MLAIIEINVDFDVTKVHVCRRVNRLNVVQLHYGGRQRVVANDCEYGTYLEFPRHVAASRRDRQIIAFILDLKLECCGGASFDLNRRKLSRSNSLGLTSYSLNRVDVCASFATRFPINEQICSSQFTC